MADTGIMGTYVGGGGWPKKTCEEVFGHKNSSDDGRVWIKQRRIVKHALRFESHENRQMFIDKMMENGWAADYAMEDAFELHKDGYTATISTHPSWNPTSISISHYIDYFDVWTIEQKAEYDRLHEENRRRLEASGELLERQFVVATPTVRWGDVIVKKFDILDRVQERLKSDFNEIDNIKRLREEEDRDSQ
jgi:hypothetical protein